MFDLLSELANSALEGEELTSWCGGAEAGVAVAAADHREGSKARKKRKRLALEGGVQAIGTGGSYQTQWASLPLQKQAFRYVAISAFVLAEMLVR